MNDKTMAPSPEERLSALLGLLAARRPDPPSDCPPDEQLASFIAGQLTGPPRQDMLAHLNRCQACYHHWLEVAAFVDANRPTENQAAITPASRWRALRHWLSGGWMLVPATAALATLAYFAVVPLLRPDLEGAVDQTYAALQAQDGAALAQTAAGLPMPESAGALGFSDAAPPPSAQAFEAGLKRGRLELVDGDGALRDFLSSRRQDGWAESEQAAYYAFGRWSVSLWVELRSERAANNRDRHLTTADRILAGLKATAATDPKGPVAVAAAEDIRAQLAGLGEIADAAAQARLRRRIELTIQQLFP